MKMILGLVLFLLANDSTAQGIPSDVFDVTPDKYTCSDQTSAGGSESRRKFAITKNSNKFSLAFLEKLRPGSLADYLEAVGVDERIIASYFEWEVAPIEIPVDSCQAKTFGSQHAEKLSCRATGIKMVITAKYRNAHGTIKTDRYAIENVDVDLDTKVRPGLKGTTCHSPMNGIKKAVVLDFEASFKAKDGKLARVSSTSAFHPYCDIDNRWGEGPRTTFQGSCAVEGGIRYQIGVADLIKMRETGR